MSLCSEPADSDFRQRFWGLRFGILLFAGVGFLGCQQKTPLDREFVVRTELVTSQQVTQDEVTSETYKMPQSYLDKIREVLDKHYGTPAKPRLMVPTLSSDDYVEKYDELYEAAEEKAEEEESDETIKVDFPIELKALMDTDQLREGQAIYNRRCAACHGQSGDGDGPEAKYMDPKPRDYRLGIFKFTSTPRGQKPTRADLELFLRRGARGTSMPAFHWLPDEELQPLVDYIFMLSHRGELEYRLWNWAKSEGVAVEVEPGDPLPEEETDPDTIAEMDAEFRFAVVEWAHRVTDSWREAASKTVYPATPMPVMTEETIALGEAAYFRRGCNSCHGDDGKSTDWRGVDQWNNPIRAANIPARMFRGGARPIDLYQRIYNGVSGTPMAGNGDAVENKETIWHLVHFVEAVSNGRKINKPAQPETVASETE